MDSVILGILTSLSVREDRFSEHPKVHASKQGLFGIYVNSSKDVYLNLSVDKVNLSDFSLNKISNVHSRINLGAIN